MIATREVVANRLYGANLEEQNVALVYAVGVLQDAARGKTVTSALGVPSLKGFINWLPFICDELCPPVTAETSVAKIYEPPDSCSLEDIEAACSLFRNRQTPTVTAEVTSKASRTLAANRSVSGHAKRKPSIVGVGFTRGQ